MPPLVQICVRYHVARSDWERLTNGKPIVATGHLFAGLTAAQLRDVWGEYARWVREIKDTLPEEDLLFSTNVDNTTVWVIEDGAAHTLMYPEDY